LRLLASTGNVGQSLLVIVNQDGLPHFKTHPNWNMVGHMRLYLVGADWNLGFFDFPFRWECHHPTDELHHFSEG